MRLFGVPFIMATKQDRLTIDLQGLRPQIESYRDDAAWRELSLTKKIRLLIEAGLASGALGGGATRSPEPFEEGETALPARGEGRRRRDVAPASPPPARAADKRLPETEEDALMGHFNV